MMKKIWVTRDLDENKVAELSRNLHISTTLAAILLARGIDDTDAAQTFLNPDLVNMHNPFLLPDIYPAIERIKRAIKQKEHIHIFGDRDVDGITSTAIAVDFLHKFKAKQVTYTVPSGDMGYGLSREAVDMIKDLGADLIITVDCGITNNAEIEYAKERGMDVIVIDHHEPQEELPNAVAVIDAKRTDSQYPFSELAGVGVTFKSMLALALSNAKDFNREFVIFDLETTGYYPHKNEIIEIGAVKVKNGLIIDEFQSFVKPKAQIPSHITRITGIDDSMVRNAPTIDKVLPEFIEFIGDATIVAHNIDFDMGFIDYNIQKLRLKPLRNPRFDTLQYAREFYPGVSHALGSITAAMGIQLDQAHRAIHDARATAQLFMRLYARTDVYKSKLKKRFIADYLELVALGTIADMVPLVDENRILVSYGLNFLSKTKRPGLKLLLEQAALYNKKIKAEDVAWKLSPLLNAAGRMQQADVAEELLLAESEHQARKTLELMLALNNDRKTLSNRNKKIIDELLPEQVNIDEDRIFVVYTDRIEHGVTGVIANGIMREYGRPVIILIEDREEGTAQGAGRAPVGFDLLKILDECKDLLVQYGGHSQAVGLTIKLENIPEFVERVKILAIEQTEETEVLPEIYIDAKLSLEDIDIKLIKELEKLEPIGFGNPAPVFLTEAVLPVAAFTVGMDKAHLRLKFITKRRVIFDAIAFNLAREMEEVEMLTKRPLDIVYSLSENKFRDKVSYELMIKDLRYTDE